MRFWCLLFYGFLLLLPAQSAQAEEAVSAALAEDQFGMRAGFSGAEVQLFGAVEGEAEAANLLIVLSGPPRDAELWRKRNVAGLWVNRDHAAFAQVPAFFAYAATVAPDPKVLEKLIPAPHGEGAGLSPETAGSFDAALMRLMHTRGLWQGRGGEIEFLGPSLFRARFFVPSLASPGRYHADVYLQTKDGRLAHQQRLALNLERTGLAGQFFDLATQQPLLYGFAAIFFAILTGWSISALIARRR